MSRLFAPAFFVLSRVSTMGGFAMVGTLKNVGYKHGRWLDSVLMQRSLGAGETTPPTR